MCTTTRCATPGTGCAHRPVNSAKGRNSRLFGRHSHVFGDLHDPSAKTLAYRQLTNSAGETMFKSGSKSKHRDSEPADCRGRAWRNAMAGHIIGSDEGAIRTIVMRRPEKKNALTPEMFIAMGDAINSAQSNPDIRCLI